MIFDSDVIIWFLRKNETAADIIESADEVAISAVTYMEVMRGLRTREELHETKFMFADYGFDTLPLTETIGYRAMSYVEEHRDSGLSVLDALIAATAVENGLPLCTANAKHYRPLKDLELVPFRP